VHARGPLTATVKKSTTEPRTRFGLSRATTSGNGWKRKTANVDLVGTTPCDRAHGNGRLQWSGRFRKKTYRAHHGPFSTTARVSYPTTCYVRVTSYGDNRAARAASALTGDKRSPNNMRENRTAVMVSYARAGQRNVVVVVVVVVVGGVFCFSTIRYHRESPRYASIRRGQRNLFKFNVVRGGGILFVRGVTSVKITCPLILTLLTLSIGSSCAYNARANRVFTERMSCVSYDYSKGPFRKPRVHIIIIYGAFSVGIRVV